MHAIKITPNLLFEYQCTSGKFITLPNRIETFLPESECSSAYASQDSRCVHTSRLSGRPTFNLASLRPLSFGYDPRGRVRTANITPTATPTNTA